MARAAFCQQAHDTNRSIISHDTGITGDADRSLAVFFQNFFCSLLDVPILYPFANMKHVVDLRQSVSWAKRCVRVI